MTDSLAREVSEVLKGDNCSGCGACPLISSRLRMELSDDGFMRPTFDPSAASAGETDRNEAALFRSVCPGVGIVAPSESGKKQHPTFGSYVSVWQAFAADDEVRFAGSSGGVLTALSTWLVDSGRVDSVVGSAQSRQEPRRTVPVTIMSRADALAAAGSRYAPVANVALWEDRDGQALVGKPCEVSAASQLHTARKTSGEMPITLSFFCAGTPSQKATDALIEEMGSTPDTVRSLRYRGNGWPGDFVAESDEQRVSLSYEESWGKHLGRELQWRCKVCVDGTGAHADIAVGDFWESDAQGFPIFSDGKGNSVAIARTQRGDELLREAARQGVVVLSAVDLADVAAVQPLQVRRKNELVGRLAGRRLAGSRIPRYTGYHLAGLAVKNAKATVRAGLGTFARSSGLKRTAVPRG